MAVYAVGDVQGCARTLDRLIERVRFDPATDRLWLAGDLVNRGPRSLAVLRRVRALGDAALVVLGNHDVHLLARVDGVGKVKKRDTFDDVLGAPDRDELVDWLRGRPLLHAEDGFVLVHAGLPPGLSLDDHIAMARSAERFLRGGSDDRRAALKARDTAPPRWKDAREPVGRGGFALNAFTRMRVCYPDGALELAFDDMPNKAPAGTRPWFTFPQPQGVTVVHGHWSMLGFEMTPGRISLDSGCVYGHSLTAVRLSDRKVWQQPFSD